MNTTKHASLVRTARKIHRVLAASLFILFLLLPTTGIMLGWKKNSGDLLLPRSYKGATPNTDYWLSFDSLKTVALKTLSDSIGAEISTELERIDARPSQGMVKFVFRDHYWEVQLDASTAKVLTVSKRRSDIIENIHDGSILDHLFKTRDGFFKVVYTSIIGLTLLTLSLTGFCLWYVPKIIRKKRRESPKNPVRESSEL
ncbi:MAG: PepSY domain-containing protein [Bacteroidota bacterium]|nr:PepSY domain-containing protein [Bacteroidota bacterium]